MANNTSISINIRLIFISLPLSQIFIKSKRETAEASRANVKAGERPQTELNDIITKQYAEGGT